MLKKFLNNQDGNYAVIFSLMMLPIMGAVGLSVDFSNLSRLKYNLGSSIDTAGTAAALAWQSGEARDQASLQAIAQKYFDENFDPNYKQFTNLVVLMPNANGATEEEKELRTQATLTYHPYFGPMMASLTGSDANRYVTLVEQNSMKLQVRAEIALVLDNSGSMTDIVTGGGTRLALLKEAAKKLVADTISTSSTIKGLNAPVRFSLVPFAGSVNVGATYAQDSTKPTVLTNTMTRPWMDARGISPVHHEHLNWGAPSTSNPTGYRTLAADGAKLDAAGLPLTRISVRDALRYRRNGNTTSTCLVSSTSGSCAVYTRTGAVLTAAATDNPGKFAWSGCVEARPYPYSVDDTAASSGTPRTLFVPWFAPDEFNATRFDTSATRASLAYNNWWPDRLTDTSGISASNTTLNISGSGTYPRTTTAASRTREINVAKYFQEQPFLSGHMNFMGGVGPNSGCTTTPIMPLTENTTQLIGAIDNMVANGATNVTEGMAWGWRTVSSTEPFTEGNPETRQDINKVVIVVTDGRNTYYTPSSLGAVDYAGNQSIYSTHGFPAWNGNTGTNGTAVATSSSNKGRIFENTSQAYNAYSNTNYTTAMISQMGTLCQNIKDKDIMLMTIGLDLNTTSDAAMITALSSCAGSSNNRKEADGTTPKKLFWNATSSTLDSAFNEITDELSNLRFTN